MRDPHVKRLHFSVGHSDEFIYDNPAPLSFDNQLGAFHLEAGHLTVEPAEHFSSESEAREAVGPFLLAWTMEASLSRNVGVLGFEFERADVIDRNPPAPGENYFAYASAHATIGVSCSMSLQTLVREYPKPSSGLEYSSHSHTVYRRYLQFTQGKESIYDGLSGIVDCGTTLRTRPAFQRR